MAAIKLYSWNINGLRAVLRKNALQTFLEKEKPDVLCLQEIKCKPDQLDLFEANALKDYEIFWNPAERPGYSGTAILLKKNAVRSEECSSEGSSSASEQQNYDKNKTTNDFSVVMKTEGRVLAVDLGDFYLVNVYTPNSKPDLSRLALREQTWDPKFLNFLKTLEKNKPIVTCGDFNAAHEEIDLARPKTNHHSAGFTDEERKGITNLISKGFVDTFRYKNPDSARYTWWSHWGKARENNVGWRIDYFFISKSLEKNLVSAEIHESILGSDHCPISITLDLKEKGEF